MQKSILQLKPTISDWMWTQPPRVANTPNTPKIGQNRPKMALFVVHRNRMAVYRLLVVAGGSWRLVGVFGGANEHFTVQIDRFGPSRRGVQIVENGRKWSKMVVFCS